MARSPIRAPSEVTRDRQPRRSRTVKEVRHREPTTLHAQSAFDGPSMDELRSMRADFYSEPPQQRRRSVTDKAVREESRRTERTSRVSVDKETKRPKIGVRATDSSGRRERREKQREADDGGSRVYVYTNKEQDEPLQRRPSHRPAAASSVASHRADRLRERYAPRREPSWTRPQRRRLDDHDAEVVVVRTERRSAPPISSVHNRDPLQR